jgi:hypothetical protein
MNRYAAPTAPPLEPLPSRAGVAIVIGAAIGNGIAYAVLFVLSLAFVWVLTLQGVKAPELYVRMGQSTSYLVLAHAAGFVSLLPGGYWSARLNPNRPLLAATGAGGIVVALTIASFLLPYDLPLPLWSRVTSVVDVIPAFVLGALWRRRSSDRLAPTLDR